MAKIRKLADLSMLASFGSQEWFQRDKRPAQLLVAARQR